MLNYQSYDHLTAIRLSAGNGFVVLVWSPMGNIVTVSGYCREALSAFQAQRAGIQGVWKLLFPFSQQFLPRHLLYQCQCWIKAFAPACSPQPCWSLCRTVREKLWVHLGEMCPPQCWPNPPAPLARLGAEILSWQQTLPCESFVSSHITGKSFWVWPTDFLKFILLSICSETALLVGAMSGWSLAAGLWSLALVWLAFIGDTLLSGFAW